MITPLDRADPDEIEALLDRAFGADRRSRTAYRLREGARAIPALSFAAWDGDALAGTLQSWPVVLDAVPLALVGPVAVEPTRQGTGIGTALMTALLAAADERPLCMIGGPEYYGRFGFSAGGTAGWRVPGPVERHRLLARGTPLPNSGMLVGASACVTTP